MTNVRKPLAGKSQWTKIAALRDHIGLAESLRSWGQRIGSRARAALLSPGRYRKLAGPADERLEAISVYYAIHPEHAFHVAPLRWFRPTEAQVTGALAHFLTAGGAPRILAFLSAVDPTIVWPRAFATTGAIAEVRTRKGRIDLLITCRTGTELWGAVIEAKFGHNLKNNPLGDYIAHARRLGLMTPSTHAPARTCAFFVVGQSATETTRQRLVRNPHWRFLAWDALLRRFERALIGISDDADFRQCRRTIWERIR